MAKTVTLRLPDNTYELIKKAAAGQRRSISNFIEVATLAYIIEDSFVSDDEMEDILNDKKMVRAFENGKRDIQNDDYRIVE